MCLLLYCLLNLRDNQVDVCHCNTSAFPCLEICSVPQYKYTVLCFYVSCYFLCTLRFELSAHKPFVEFFLKTTEVRGGRHWAREADMNSDLVSGV